MLPLVVADHPDHLYQLGETAIFSIRLPDANSPPHLTYRVSNDGNEILDQGLLNFSNGTAAVRCKLTDPGFLRLDVLNLQKESVSAASVGYEPLKILPVSKKTPEFESFWSKARDQKLDNPKVLSYEKNTCSTLPGETTYRVLLENLNGTTVHGWLTLPEIPPPYPVVLNIPGAGVGRVKPVSWYTHHGIAAIQMSVHDVELDLPEEAFDRLRACELAGYTIRHAESPDRYYFHRTILGAFGVLDFLCEHPNISTGKVGITGSSQGGGLALLVAGLDRRVAAVSVNVPTLCDHKGYQEGRPSGWPHFWKTFAPERVCRTMALYDAAIAAETISAAAYFSVGFLDRTCPPTTVCAAYNALKSSKDIQNHIQMAHAFPESWYEDSASWMRAQLT